MNRRKYILIGLVILIPLIWFAYRVFDQSITLSDCSDEVGHLQLQILVLEKVAMQSSIGKRKNEFILFFKKNQIEYFAKGDNVIVANEVGFVFEKGKLIRILSGDDQDDGQGD